MRGVLFKFVMPSAPSVAHYPFASQIAGLTTGEDQTLGGVVYASGRIVECGTFTSSQDGSRGQGGYAVGLQGSITITDVVHDADGNAYRLYPLVESGAIPLVGAVVTIMDEGGNAAAQTWIVQEPKQDGATLTLSLKTLGYLDARPLAFPARRRDGYVGVGVAVGEHQTSVPTKTLAAATAQPYPMASAGGYSGNPGSHGGAAWRMTTEATETGTVGSSDLDGWVSGRRWFSFNFPTDGAAAAEFWSRYLDYNGTLEPNIAVLITDGTNTETILYTDSNGAPQWARTAKASSYQRTFVVSSYGGEAFGGYGARYTPSATEKTELVWRHETTATSYGTTSLHRIVVCVRKDGALADVTEANSISLVVARQESPICAGADSLVGFLGASSSGYSLMQAAGDTSIQGNVLHFVPRKPLADGFVGYARMDKRQPFFLGSASTYEAGTTSFAGAISNVSCDPDVIPSAPFSMTYLGAFGAQPELYLYHRFTDADLPISSPTGILVDHNADYQAIAGRWDISNILHPFDQSSPIVDVSLEAGAKYTDGLRSIKYDSAFRLFKSLSDVPNPDIVTAVAASYDGSSPSYSFLVRLLQVIFWAQGTISYGNNPAVVIPGTWPGTSNPTTTPAMAAAQLANWIGVPLRQTGGIAPSLGAWGEYMGPDSSSTDGDAIAAKTWLHNLLNEAWIFGAEASAAATPPTIEKVIHPVLEMGSIDDVVTMPAISYDYAGTSAQYTARILNVDNSFDLANGSGHHWAGWQEKDVCRFLTDPGAAFLAMAAVDDSLVGITATGIRVSRDGGITWADGLTSSGAAVAHTTTMTYGAVAGGNSVLYALANNGGTVNAWTSTDGGITWARVSALESHYGPVSAAYSVATSKLWIAFVPGTGTVVVATWDGSSSPTGILSVSGATSARVVAAAGYAVVAISGSSGGAGYHGTTPGAMSVVLSSTSYGYEAVGYWDGHFWVTTSGDPTCLIIKLTPEGSRVGSYNLPARIRSMATDGNGVVAGIRPDGPEWVYSRDNGATWAKVSLGGYAYQTSIGDMVWDDDNSQFVTSNFGRARMVALGDPSLLDIWQQCRAAYLATGGTAHSETYDWRGLYEASEVISWLLDHKDGIDLEWQCARLAWLTRQARFLTLEVEYASVVNQLSCTAFLPIAIPRQRIGDCGEDSNIPTTGLITKAEHNIITGESSIEIMLPPL